MGGLKMKKAAIFDSSVKYGGFCYTSSLNFLGAGLLWLVSYSHYFIYYGLILSVDSSRVATAGEADFRRSRVGRCAPM
jgi:hypothetical protein